jgi:hypothetical protein
LRFDKYEGITEEVQSVLFFGDWHAINSLKLAGHINEGFAYLLDGHPLVFPVDENTPPEVPRFIFRSQDESVVLQLGPQRATLIERLPTQLGADDVVEGLANMLADEFAFSLNRLGRVIRFSVNLDKCATTFLRERYLGPGVVDHPAQANVQWLTKKPLGEETVNQWTMLDSASESPGTGLRILIDTNLLEDADRRVSKDSVREFFRNASEDTMSVIEGILQEGLR